MNGRASHAIFERMKNLPRDELIRQLAALEPVLRAEGVTRLALFGSRARQDNRPDSDIDVMIDVDEAARFSLLNLVGVEHVIQDNLGLPANAFMRRSLDEGFRQSTKRDVVEVFS